MPPSPLVALAPMSGLSDSPFRNLCRELGTPLTVSEMVAAHPDMRTRKKTCDRLGTDRTALPEVVQIVGSCPDRMAAAAQLLADQGVQTIDINMGCPAKKVLKRAAGSALLSDEPLVKRMLKTIVDAVRTPVTLKMRTGPCPDNRNAVRIACIAADAGIRRLAIHGRTRRCRFVGPVEYRTITEVVEAVPIPVLVNGDIRSPQQARNLLSQTGAAGVMIGRAALGSPWLPGQTNHYLRTGELLPAPSVGHWLEIVLRHLRAVHDYYGLPRGMHIARKHIRWYLDRIPSTETLARRVNLLDSAQAQIDALCQWFGTRHDLSA